MTKIGAIFFKTSSSAAESRNVFDLNLRCLFCEFCQTIFSLSLLFEKEAVPKMGFPVIKIQMIAVIFFQFYT